MDRKCIGFIGFGLIAGSIARSLHIAHPDWELIAFDRDSRNTGLALQDGVISAAAAGVDESFTRCDYVFLCMPVSENIACLKILKDLLPPQCVITDVGSVKTGIHEAVRKLGMENRFIGGHPMAGTEKSGYANSSSLILENAWYILTPTPKTPAESLRGMKQIALDIRTLPVVLDCRVHDRTTSIISHLPHVIAFSLVNLVRTSDSSEGLMRQLAAGGFRDITRIASSSPDMWESICLENREPLIDAIDSYKGLLDGIEEAVKSGDGQFLYDFFQQARDYRDDMPSRNPGSITPAYDLFVDIIDESGAIATLATILASNNISIKNIAIIHNREFEDGVLRIEFYHQADVEKAAKILGKFSYTIHRR